MFGLIYEYGQYEIMNRSNKTKEEIATKYTEPTDEENNFTVNFNSNYRCNL